VVILPNVVQTPTTAVAFLPVPTPHRRWMITGRVWLWLYGPVARRSRSEFVSERTSALQQGQLAGTSYRFGAPPYLELAKNVPVVPFDSNQGEEKPLADLTVRESLGDELQYFQLALAQWLDKGLGR
jgi:hypothetical protein